MPPHPRLRVFLPWSFLLVVCTLAASCAKPTLHALPRGTPVSLGDDEGLLVVQVDSDTPIEEIRLDGAVIPGPIPSGPHLWLVRLPAGDYRWAGVRFGSAAGKAQRVTLDDGAWDVDEAELLFDVEAGKLNYPGELVVRTNDATRSVGRGMRVRVRNHAGRAVRGLEETDPGLLDAFPIRNAGRRVDDFLAHYSEERRRIDGAIAAGSRED